jgi:hypothetical protein
MLAQYFEGILMRIRQPQEVKMKSVFVIAVFFAAASFAFCVETFVSDSLGFEMTAPKPAELPAVYQHSIFYLPAADGFAANVNVQIQAFDGTIEDYQKISEGQFREAKLNITTSEVKAGVFRTEYSGKLENYDLHWYARAVKKGGRVYLVTGTALNKRWKTEGQILIHSVESFKLK